MDTVLGAIYNKTPQLWTTEEFGKSTLEKYQ